MKVKIKCPGCGKNIYFKCCYENRKKAKIEKQELQVTFDILKECKLIHS